MPPLTIEGYVKDGKTQNPVNLVRVEIHHRLDNPQPPDVMYTAADGRFGAELEDVRIGQRIRFVFEKEEFERKVFDLEIRNLGNPLPSEILLDWIGIEFYVTDLHDKPLPRAKVTVESDGTTLVSKGNFGGVVRVPFPIKLEGRTAKFKASLKPFFRTEYGEVKLDRHAERYHPKLRWNVILAGVLLAVALGIAGYAFYLWRRSTVPPLPPPVVSEVTVNLEVVNASKDKAGNLCAVAGTTTELKWTIKNATGLQVFVDGKRAEDTPGPDLVKKGEGRFGRTQLRDTVYRFEATNDDGQKAEQTLKVPICKNPG